MLARFGVDITGVFFGFVALWAGVAGFHPFVWFEFVSVFVHSILFMLFTVFTV
jgi:hypothetical protein